MSKRTVFLDRQHSGQIHKPHSYGAFCNIVGRHEADLTAEYLLAAERSLREFGIAVIPISDGRYSERHARVLEYAAKAQGRTVYVAAHLNAGGGDYSCAFYDHRSKMGKNCASHVADAMGELPELRRSLAKPATPEDWTKNAHATIGGVYVGRPCGLCFEPCFVDNDDHKQLLEPEGLVRIGRALAEGIHNWMEQ